MFPLMYSPILNSFFGNLFISLSMFVPLIKVLIDIAILVLVFKIYKILKTYQRPLN